MSDTNLPKPGRYRGKVLDYCAKAQENGQPAIAIRVAFKDGDNFEHEVTWQGNLSQGTDPTKKRPIEVTLETLEVCGFDFHKHKSLAIIAEGADSGALDLTREIMITVELTTWNGSQFARARFLNHVGGFKGAMEQKDFVIKTQGLNLEAEIMKYRAKVPQQSAAPARASANGSAPPMAANIDDIPF